MVPTGTLSPVGGFPCNPTQQKLAIDPDRIKNQGFLIALFCRISTLSRNRKRACFAHTKTLAGYFGCSEDRVSRGIERLRQIGAVAVEHIVGVMRLTRPLVTLDKLKSILFPGHPSNWVDEPVRAPARAPRSRVASGCQRSSRAVSCPDVAAPVAEGVAGGHKRESYGLLTDLPSGKKTTTHGPRVAFRPMTSSVVVSSPSATASKPEPDPATLAAVVALGVPEAQVPRLIAGKSAATVRQAVRAVAGYLAKKPGNAARLFTVAIREGWTPSAPPSDAPSDHGERPVRIVRAPKEYLERLTATAPEAPRMPQEAPQGSGGADHPTGGREAFRATVQRLRGNTAHA